MVLKASAKAILKLQKLKWVKPASTHQNRNVD
jgi:hypothetical protein